MIRRHPHVFGGSNVKTADEVVELWERVKKEEKKERKSCLEGIPKTLGALARAQKLMKISRDKKSLFTSKEEEFGKRFIDLVTLCCLEKVDAESAVA